MIRKPSLFALLPFVAGLTAAVERTQQGVFHAAVNTVAVYATVRDASGHLLTDLTAADFVVSDNGHPVTLSLFSNEPQPITAVALLEASNSVVVPRELQSVRSFIHALRPSDRLRLGTVGGSEINLSPHLTNDPAILDAILREEMWFSLPGPLMRGIDMAMTSLSAESGRRVVLVLADGEPGATYCLNCATMPSDLRVLPDLAGGQATLKQRLLRESDFMIYAIGFLDGAGLGQLLPHTTDVAELSGGGHFNLSPSADVAETFAVVAEELRHQYMIGFTPTALDGREHRLEVRTIRRGATVRARASFVAKEGS